MENLQLEEEHGNMEMMVHIGGSGIWIDKSIEYNLHLKENLSGVMNIQCFSALESAVMYLADHAEEVSTLIFANNVASEIFTIIPL